MKKQELIKLLDREMLDRLFGFCYARTNNSHEAEDLSSDITLEILKQAKTDGEIENAEAYVWRVAHNVYAKYSEKRRAERERSYEGDADEYMNNIADEDVSYSDEEDLKSIFRAIAFLARSYRDVTVAFYLDAKPTAVIARELGISETAVRQRLFYSRNEIRNEVMNMDKIQKPTSFDHIEYEIWGTGNPAWSDPREVCERDLSHHIMSLCSKKPRTAKELSEELNVPMIYVEDEINILLRGQYGRYGVLREVQSGKYGMNFVLLDKEQTKRAWSIFEKRTPFICKTVKEFVKAHESEYLALPYINKNVTLNAVLWQQVQNIGYNFNRKVKEILAEKFFPGVEMPKREFSVFGFENFGKNWFGGCDGITARNILGHSYVHITNIYSYSKEFPIEPHFHCGRNLANDEKLQMSIRAINGLDVNTLSDDEKETAAKAIEENYIYRDGDTLYTKFLVMNYKDDDAADKISDKIVDAFSDEAEKTAAEVAALIREVLPEHLIPEYKFFANLAAFPVCETLIKALIDDGILEPLRDKLNAETVWMSVKK
ncbi:MAG: RNA polymerase sigma factor [Clostridia bacterium]|nr:RNA polymerase sigma factor [Clostridia bacterium]